MDIAIRTIRKQDFDAARRFAVHGMHLHWYATGRLELYLYSLYFWNLEITRATRALGAYMGDRLVGVLLVDMKGEPKVFPSFFRRAFVWLADLVIKSFYRGAADVYHKTNEKMLGDFLLHHRPDGELNFFAIDPTITGKGIGTLLLDELERLEAGKLIYLFTDSGSTYQFYQRRQFDEAGRQNVTIEIDAKELDLTCFLFSKTL